MKKYIIVAIAFLSLTALVSCGGSGSAEPATTKKEGEHEDSHENPNTATLTEEQIKSIGIEMGIIEEKQLTASLKTNGVLKVAR